MPGRRLEFWDRIVASDPGLARLRVAGSAAVGMSSVMALEYGFATATHAGTQGILIAMMLGAVVAMMGSMALTNIGVWANTRTALFFPVAIGSGMLAGVAVGSHTDLMLSMFVVVMFAAVFMRRFGLPFFFYGFMLWMGYFFAAFLHATMSMLPALLEAVAIATAWLLLLSITLLRTNSTRILRRTVRAFDARARAVARTGAELLELARVEQQPRPRLRRRLHAQQARLAEVALMVEARSAEPGARYGDWPAPALRRRLLDAQQAIDDLAAATDGLAVGNARLATAAFPVLDRLARRDDAGAKRAAQALAELAERAGREQPAANDTSGWWPARHLAVAALEFVGLVGRVETPPQQEEIDEFDPAVKLAMGNLTGAPAAARDVPARGGRWNPLARLDMTTRQAIQVAVAGGLAILVGRELSATRYYWAVIAAFVMFTGTGTRSETFLKGFNRVAGTLIGLVASIGLAHLTAGHTSLVLVVIVASMFCGFYLTTISYAYMIFFVTIMVGQLYSVLHEFSDGLLVLRLEETAIGAAIGFAVALVVVPLSTRDTVRTARDNLLGALSELLTAAAGRLDGTAPTDPPADLDRLARSLDDRLRQLALVARPLTRPLVWGNSPPRTRHRLTLHAATATHARALTVALRRGAEFSSTGADACRALVTAINQLVEAAPGHRQPAAVAPLAEVDSALFTDRRAVPGARATDPVPRSLIHLHRLLRELAEPGTVTRSEVAPECDRPPAGGVRGTVRGPGAVGPLAEVNLAMLDSSGNVLARTCTDRNGRYQLPAFPCGDYVLVVLGYPTSTVPARLDSGVSHAVHLNLR